MNINIEIEKIILDLDKIYLSPSQRRQLQAVVEVELSRLFTENGVPASLQDGASIPSLPANLNVTKNTNPSQMGQQIAHSIYGGLTT